MTPFGVVPTPHINLKRVLPGVASLIKLASSFIVNYTSPTWRAQADIVNQRVKRHRKPPGYIMRNRSSG